MPFLFETWLLIFSSSLNIFSPSLSSSPPLPPSLPLVSPAFDRLALYRSGWAWEDRWKDHAGPVFKVGEGSTLVARDAFGELLGVGRRELQGRVDGRGQAPRSARGVRT